MIEYDKMFGCFQHYPVIRIERVYYTKHVFVIGHILSAQLRRDVHAM